MGSSHYIFPYKGSTSEEESSTDSSHEEDYKQEQHPFKDNQFVLPESDENSLHEEENQEEKNRFDEEEISVEELNDKEETIVSNECASDNQSSYPEEGNSIYVEDNNLTKGDEQCFWLKEQKYYLLFKLLNGSF